jgi:hypothetical protein
MMYTMCLLLLYMYSADVSYFCQISWFNRLPVIYAILLNILHDWHFESKFDLFRVSNGVYLLCMHMHAYSCTTICVYMIHLTYIDNTYLIEMYVGSVIKWKKKSKEYHTRTFGTFQKSYYRITIDTFSTHEESYWYYSRPYKVVSSRPRHGHELKSHS